MRRGLDFSGGSCDIINRCVFVNQRSREAAGAFYLKVCNGNSLIKINVDELKCFKGVINLNVVRSTFRHQ